MDFGPSLLEDLLKDSLTRKDMGISWDAATGMTTGFADPLSYVENRFAAATPRYAGVEAGVGSLMAPAPGGKEAVTKEPETTEKTELDIYHPDNIQRAVTAYERATGSKWSEGNIAWLNQRPQEAEGWLKKWLSVTEKPEGEE